MEIPREYQEKLKKIIEKAHKKFNKNLEKLRKSSWKVKKFGSQPNSMKFQIFWR